SLTFLAFFFFSSRRRHTRFSRDWSSDVCSSDLSASIVAATGAAIHEPTSRTFIPRNSRSSDMYHSSPSAVHGTGTGPLWERPPRSEERRVGKECRSRRPAYEEKRRRTEGTCASR